MKFLIVLRNRVISDMQMIFLVLKVYGGVRADAKFERNLCAKPEIENFRGLQNCQSKTDHHQSETGGMLALRGPGRFSRTIVFPLNHELTLTPPIIHWWKNYILFWLL